MSTKDTLTLMILLSPISIPRTVIDRILYDLDPDLEFNPLSNYFDPDTVRDRRLATLSNPHELHIEYCLTCNRYHVHRHSFTLTIQCPSCYLATDINHEVNVLGRAKLSLLSTFYHLRIENTLESEYLATICYKLLDRYYQHRNRRQ